MALTLANWQGVSAAIQQPQELVKLVRRLHKTHCADASEATETASEEIQQEHNRQREFLERTIDALKKKMTKGEQLHKEETSRVMQENVTLIKEINDLRQELRLAQKQSQGLEATLRTTRNLQKARGFDTGASGGGGLGGSTASLAAMLGDGAASAAFHDAAQLERIVDMQKAEIRSGPLVCAGLYVLFMPLTDASHGRGQAVARHDPRLGADQRDPARQERPALARRGAHAGHWQQRLVKPRPP